MSTTYCKSVCCVYSWQWSVWWCETPLSRSCTSATMSAMLPKCLWTSLPAAATNMASRYHHRHHTYQLSTKSTIPWIALNEWMALNSLICADVPLRNCSLTLSTEKLNYTPSVPDSVHYPSKGGDALRLGSKGSWFLCGWQVKLCVPIVTHGPYLSTLETGHNKALYKFTYFTLLYFANGSILWIFWYVLEM